MSDENMTGYLFLCTNRTQNECFDKKLFGAIRQYIGYVQEIKKGDLLFLYNTISNSLFGVFKAADRGAWNIDPRAWENVRPLEFPAQVSVEWNKLHKVSNATRKIKFLKKTSKCKLSVNETKELVNVLEQSTETL